MGQTNYMMKNTKHTQINANTDDLAVTELMSERSNMHLPARIAKRGIEEANFSFQN